ncbi:sulfatase-like hydrolase/transferase [Confluentibacter sediminis]|uniref:sulfatase-like hydrolase/transferase n=1 Tax=Confluentibacter sediminis TaxID=2219045 RepID=UPI000DAECBE9|nr:sulfatase-like hydrolase/transferase [Confluentibacter sediminis]
MKLNFKNEDIHKYACATISLLIVFWSISLFEVLSTKSTSTNILFKIVNDFWTCVFIGLILLPLYIFLIIIIKKYALILVNTIYVLLILGQFSLVKYSLTTMLNLGADILGYSFDDAFSTVSVSESISVTYFIPFIVFPLLFFILIFISTKYLTRKKLIGIGLIAIVLFGSLKLIFHNSSDAEYQNKIAFFVNDILKFQNEKRKLNTYSFSDRNDYPLLKSSKKTKDVLSPFLNINADKPNIVIIVVEGLGGEFVNNNLLSGFTPYIDSLIPQSLYWENFLSTTGRSFGILPSLLGSLPYGEKGFLELQKTPSHTSLISILKSNGYETNYYSGGPSSFDRKINFLEYNGIDNLTDESKYGPGYIKTASNDGGFSWGYPDKEIFNKTLSSLNLEKQPRLDIIMTLSSHEPFEFPDKERYMDVVEKKLQDLNISESLKTQINNHKDIFGCLLYTDNAIKDFMNAYKKRPDYSNTIFVITGDHRLIPISQKDKLCRFHVPFLIYSPLLKRPEKFKSISSHWDVTPSLLSFLTNNYKFKPLEKTSWMGDGLDTTKSFRNIHKIPLMRYKGSLNDYIYKDYLFSDGELFKIKENFGIYKVNEEAILKTISDSLTAFKELNAYVTQSNKIFPDSLNIYITPKIEFSQEQLAKINTFSKNKTFDELLFTAHDLAYKKQYETARLLCDYILNEFPNYTDARILKGRTLAWEQKYNDSEIELLNALKRSPYYDDTYLALFDMYWWSSQEKKSEILYNLALKNNITNPEVGFKMAKAYARLNNKFKAEKIMDSIINIDSKNVDYLNFKKTL